MVAAGSKSGRRVGRMRIHVFLTAISTVFFDLALGPPTAFDESGSRTASAAG